MHQAIGKHPLAAMSLLKDRTELTIAHHRQQTIMLIALALLAVAFNAFGAKNLPSVEGFLLFFDVIGFFCVLIP